MYELIITEKPKASLKIATALADTKAIKKSNIGVSYYELSHKGKDIVVACAVGHLYGLAEKEKDSYNFPVFDIEIDGAPEKAAGIIVMNGRYYGGRHMIAPGNQLEEPGFATIVLKDGGWISALKYLAALGLGRLHKLNSVTYRTGVKRVAVNGPTGERVQVDGDNALSVPVVLQAGTGHVNVVCGEGSVGRGGA